MAKLSKYQSEIVEEMRKPNVFLWHNEGEGFRAWLGNNEGERIKGVRVRSVEVLSDVGIIQLVDGVYSDELFKYELAKGSR